MINFHKLFSIINENNSILISSHVNPDADAIGSEMALYYALNRLGKQVRVINYSPTPYYLQFLDPNGIIELYNENIHKNIFEETDLFIGVDFNQSSRIIAMQSALIKSKTIKAIIDHHLNPEDFADFSFIDNNYSSTGEIVYDFFIETNIVEIDKLIAEAIYAAIMTDTGSFRFDRTTSKTHRVIAELLERGANPSEIYDRIYNQNKPGKLKLLGRALENIKFKSLSRIAYMIITKKDLLECDSQEEDVDNFVNYCLSIKGIKLGILFLELENGFKVSFRSKGDIPVNELAAEFGGGGHKNASGLRVFNKSLSKSTEIILLSAEKYLT